MQITLQHNEIEKALQAFVLQHVAPQANAQIAVTLKAGRGERNFSAIVDIVPHGQPLPKHDVDTAKTTAKAPATSKAVKASDAPGQAAEAAPTVVEEAVAETTGEEAVSVEEAAPEPIPAGTPAAKSIFAQQG